MISKAVYRLSSGGGVLSGIGTGVQTLTSLNLGLALEIGLLKADSLKSSWTHCRHEALFVKETSSL